MKDKWRVSSWLFGLRSALVVPWIWATVFLRVLPTPCSSVRKVSCSDLAGRLDTNKVLLSLASSNREKLSVALEESGGTLVLFLATSSCCHSYGKLQLAPSLSLSLSGSGTPVPGRGQTAISECECIKCCSGPPDHQEQQVDLALNMGIIPTRHKLWIECCLMYKL